MKTCIQQDKGRVSSGNMATGGKRAAVPVVATTLFWLTIAVLAIPNVSLCFTEVMPLPSCLANVILPVSAVWLLMTFSRKPGKMTLVMFPLIFLAAFQMVLLYLFGRSIIAVDMFLNLVTTNPGEAFELLDNLTPAIIFVVVAYVPPLVLAVVSLRKGHRLGRGFIQAQRRYALCGMVAGAACVGWSHASVERYGVLADLYPANVFYNMKLAVDRHYATNHYAETSAGFRFNAKATHDKDAREVYVMVIGETARAANFNIYGYGRQTTPLLRGLEGKVVFKNALSQSNTTHKSVPMLLSAASAEDYDSMYRERGIISAFKEAGFHTVFISNQKPNHSFIDFFGKEADEWVFIKEKICDRNVVTDEMMLPWVKAVLGKGRRKEFIVLHAYGSHFNYHDRYERKDAYFRPDEDCKAKASNKASLVNAYDNTIRVTDRFLYLLAMELERPGYMSAWIYTSDHGENIFDDNRGLFLHASPVPSFHELHVPFIVWMSEPYRHAMPEVASALYGNRDKAVATSASAFHTMLGVAGIDTPLRNDSLSLASGLYRAGRRVYLDDHNRPVPLERLLTDKEDVRKLKKLRVKNVGN